MKQFSKFFSIAALIGLVLVLPGCGPRQKNLLNKLSVSMTKEEVEFKMGKPDEIHCPITASNGDVIDIWEYSLATVDENQYNRRLGIAIGCLLLWPLLPIGLIALSCMESEFSYDSYFLKFVNNLLLQWGKRADVFPMQMNR